MLHAPPLDSSIEEPVQPNADEYVYNAEDDSDDGEECVLMRVMQESVDPFENNYSELVVNCLKSNYSKQT